MPDKNPMVGNVITAVATAGILGVLGWTMGIFSAGSAALDEKQIEEVIKRVLVLDNEQTYAQALNSLDGTLIKLDTTVGHLTTEINQLEVAVSALAAE